MLIKKLFLIICFSTFVYGHKVAGVDMSLERTADDQIKVKAFFQKSKKALFGNEVRFISMIDNRVLNKGKLTKDGLVLSIPNESYWVYVIVRDNDIVKDGLAPLKGFDKAVKIQKVAFLYTGLATLTFILMGCTIGYYRTRKFKQSLL